MIPALEALQRLREGNRRFVEGKLTVLGHAPEQPKAPAAGVATGMPPGLAPTN